MTTALTTEGFLGMSLIMAALFIANLSLARMLYPAWRKGEIDEAYGKEVAGPFFIYTAGGTSVMILCFLAALISLFAAGAPSEEPQTFGLSQEVAAYMFYGAGALAVLAGVGALGIFREAASTEQKAMAPLMWIAGAFAISGPIYSLLLILLVMTGSASQLNTDFFAGGAFVLIGSVFGFLVNGLFSGWFKREVQSSAIDAERLSKGTGARALFSIVMAGVPIIIGIMIIAG